MRLDFGILSIATLALAGACLSETTLDNYHDSLGAGGRVDTGGPRPGTSLVTVPAPWNSLGSVASLGIGYLRLPVASGIAAAGTANLPAEAQYQVTGYWQSGSPTRLEFGVSDTDHVIVLFEATCSSDSTSCLAIVELTANGDQLRLVQFPSATMPDVVHVMPTGEVVMAGKLERSIGFGAAPINAVEHGFYVAKLDRDWRQEFAFAVSTDR
ncbi:MAG TPA: hypothetical protein VKP30_18065, partial [Polyangiaceae bacterium]|nr:hypothetical protein [Polyangiaceae bacterium]